jgi:hypothetical protein
VRVLPDPASPFLAALGPPVVVIPRSLYSLPPGGCGGGALEAVLAHELAHLRRGDRGAAWLECTASIAFWWFPLLPLVRAELHRAADEAADAGAAAALGSPRRYAASLVEALDVLTTEPPPAVCPGLGLGERQAIERRLTMILRQPLAAGLDWKCRLAVLVLGLFILPAAAERARGQTISAAPATAATSDDRDPGAAADVPGESAIAAEPGEPAIAAEPETPPAPAGGARAASSSADAADDYGIGAGGPRPARRRATARTAPGAAAAPAATARSRGVTAAGGMAGMPRLDEVYERLERLSAELADLRAALGRPGVYGEAGQTLPPPMSPKADPNVPQDGWRVYRQLDPGSQLPGERGKSLDRWLKQLDLNEDQRRKFEELEKDHEARMKEFHQKMADLEDRHQAAIQELLTPEQREALERSRRQYRNGENPWPAAPAAPGPGGPARPRPGYGARAPIAPPGLGPRALPEPQPVEPRAKN